MQELDWSDDLVVVDASLPLAAALRRIRLAKARWVVLQRHGGRWVYAFRPHVLLSWGPLAQALSRGDVDQSRPLDDYLGLHEGHSSHQTGDRPGVVPGDAAAEPARSAPSVDLYVQLSPSGMPEAVGVPHSLGGATAVFAATRSARAMPPVATAGDEPAASVGDEPSEALPPESPAAPDIAPIEDEGTSPVRNPSIDVVGRLVPAGKVTVVVDLSRETVAHTGGSVALGPQPASWKSIPLRVYLQCSALELGEQTSATVTVRRNAPSLPAKFTVTVRADAPPGPVDVIATFMHTTRYCGSATRRLEVEPAAANGQADAQADLAAATPPPAAPATAAGRIGTVVVEPGAERPDMTVHISSVDENRPHLLRWHVSVDRFDGLPPQLEATVDIGQPPAAMAGALFDEFATLTRGQHVQSIEGFGGRLWQKAPEMFRRVYWATSQRFAGRPLRIQFISDEPHLPWELMRPVNADETEIHPPLALRHAVGRWIKRWDGYMRNALPPGGIATIAPVYPSASLSLKRAQTESDALVRDFAATRTAGTRAAVLSLLETAPPATPVALLHFAGHGQFAAAVASASSIKLEDGSLSASEVERPEVRLGRACRTLVFFNACETGASGAVFGEVGGWADAFLGRQFGGFIAPLWAVDDEDASVVASELVERVCRKGEPVGAALQAIRAAHGATSPTFYSYLYYGDVTARIGARIGA